MANQVAGQLTEIVNRLVVDGGSPMP
jgi:hypothetical protein